jgi:XTP/dITP diphosphohydrolase
MSITIIFATNNLHKIEEIKKIVPSSFHIITLKEAGINQDIPEPYNTLEENASAKSSVIHQLTQQNCFSEDTGLEVTALNGAPGVKSARYAGEGRNFEENIQKLLHNLQGKTDRSARFRTVVSLIWNKEEYYFEGICEGNIIDAPKGEQGFGYDPVFMPDGSNKTFAEMSLEEKNLFSHRRKATDKLVQFLKESAGKDQD